MSSAKEFLKWSLTLGTGPQTFLGARWIRWALDRAPASKKRLWAFRLLSLSPHYFLDRNSAENRQLRELNYFEKAAAEWLSSRARFFDAVLKDRLAGAKTVLDYGCGPGFLAATLASNIEQVYACDISSGALDCARVLNPANNLAYILADETGFAQIPTGSVDAVVSLAVVQHLSHDAYEKALEICHSKLIDGGKIIFHVQLDEGAWRKEEDWKNDTSLRGKLKYSYGLHNFGRPTSEHRLMLESAGFSDVVVEPLTTIFPDGFEDIGEQHLLTAIKG